MTTGYTTSELGFDCIVVLLKPGTFTQNHLIATLNQTLNFCSVEIWESAAQDRGLYEQVGCEKPSTLSGRQKTVLVVAVDRILCVCVCARMHACAFTILTMWVCGHSSFGEITVIQDQHCWPTKHILERKRIGFLCKRFKCGPSPELAAHDGRVKKKKNHQEVYTYCWSSLGGHTYHWDVLVLVWPPSGKPYQRCSLVQPLPPHDAHPVARCCSPACDECSRGEWEKQTTWTLCVFGALWQSRHRTSQHNNES